MIQRSIETFSCGCYVTTFEDDSVYSWHCGGNEGDHVCEREQSNKKGDGEMTTVFDSLGYEMSLGATFEYRDGFHYKVNGFQKDDRGTIKVGFCDGQDNNRQVWADPNNCTLLYSFSRCEEDEEDEGVDEPYDYQTGEEITWVAIDGTKYPGIVVGLLENRMKVLVGETTFEVDRWGSRFVRPISQTLATELKHSAPTPVTYSRYEPGTNVKKDYTLVCEDVRYDALPSIRVSQEALKMGTKDPFPDAHAKLLDENRAAAMKVFLHSQHQAPKCACGERMSKIEWNGTEAYWICGHE